MKNYDVVITETLQRTVLIEANSRDEAEQIAKEKWRKSECVLDENEETDEPKLGSQQQL